ncbi:MAG TPA: hypothetical protein VMY77_19190, partial [Chitinophagaceae bacterium]|nr:hypothetical protein [Chitinophagaceae bacterium]
KDGGKTWKDVTPASITAWSKISLMDASHFDVNTAYAAVNRIRLDDMHPHIYRTKDGGKTWREIVNGLPDDPINVVREDPLRKGLLFAGSERAVYVSFDDGEHWQSLRLNMPATSIRDLVIKDDDLVIGTHGRSFWILDNITPLRQLTNQLINQSTILYKPANAYRVRWNMWTDTPLPQEEPAGENPPDGAMIDYYLNTNAKNVSLEIQDAKGNIIRRYLNTDTMYKIPDVNIPHYWIRPQQILPAEKGSHRFLWDMRYTPLNLPPSYPISATYKNTAPNETSPFVMPGNYTARLTVDGKTYKQSFTIKMDPRIKTPVADIQRQHDLSVMVYDHRLQIQNALKEISDLRRKIKERLPDATGAAISELNTCDTLAASFFINQQGSTHQSLGSLNSSLAGVLNVLQESDLAPTSQAMAAAKDADQSFKTVWQRWIEARKKIKDCLGEN